jgi:hypothetical protein
VLNVLVVDYLVIQLVTMAVWLMKELAQVISLLDIVLMRNDFKMLYTSLCYSCHQPSLCVALFKLTYPFSILLYFACSVQL